MKTEKIVGLVFAASLGLCGTAQAASWLGCADPPVNPAAVEGGWNCRISDEYNTEIVTAEKLNGGTDVPTGLPGIFGIDEWVDAGKIDIPGTVTAGGVDIGFTGSGTDASGSFTIDRGAFDDYTIMVVFKDGNFGNWVGYLLSRSLPSAPGGAPACVGNLCTFDWTDPWSAQGSVSNITAWVIEGSGDQDVPLPGAVWLFGSALVGLVTLSRRRRVA